MRFQLAGFIQSEERLRPTEFSEINIHKGLYPLRCWYLQHRPPQIIPVCIVETLPSRLGCWYLQHWPLQLRSVSWGVIPEGINSQAQKIEHLGAWLLIPSALTTSAPESFLKVSTAKHTKCSHFEIIIINNSKHSLSFHFLIMHYMYIII